MVRLIQKIADERTADDGTNGRYNCSCRRVLGKSRPWQELLPQRRGGGKISAAQNSMCNECHPKSPHIMNKKTSKDHIERIEKYNNNAHMKWMKTVGKDTKWISQNQRTNVGDANEITISLETDGKAVRVEIRKKVDRGAANGSDSQRSKDPEVVGFSKAFDKKSFCRIKKAGHASLGRRRWWWRIFPLLDLNAHESKTSAKENANGKKYLQIVSFRPIDYVKKEQNANEKTDGTKCSKKSPDDFDGDYVIDQSSKDGIGDGHGNIKNHPKKTKEKENAIIHSRGIIAKERVQLPSDKRGKAEGNHGQRRNGSRNEQIRDASPPLAPVAVRAIADDGAKNDANQRWNRTHEDAIEKIGSAVFFQKDRHDSSNAAILNRPCKISPKQPDEEDNESARRVSESADFPGFVGGAGHDAPVFLIFEK